MLPFLTLCILFVLVLAHFRRKNDAAQSKVEEDFWSREYESNATRRQDISELDYITIPLEKLPLDLDTDSSRRIQSLASEKMIDLSSYTNTDLKLKYGATNLEALSKYECNYVDLEKTLDSYASELLDHDRTQDAITILEYAVAIGSDVGHTYLTLAGLYHDTGENAKTQELITHAREHASLNRQPFLDKMQDYLT